MRILCFFSFVLFLGQWGDVSKSQAQERLPTPAMLALDTAPYPWSGPESLAPEPDHGSNPEEYTYPSEDHEPSDLFPESHVDLGMLRLHNSAYILTGQPRPFVHEPQKVPVSERMAEIWVKLPPRLQSSVSVNFVEYPPEGEFRIFKTKLATREPRRYYLSAKSYDKTSKTWTDLVGHCPGSVEGELSQTVIVDLTPRQRVEVEFEQEVIVLAQVETMPTSTIPAPPAELFVPTTDLKIGEINQTLNNADGGHQQPEQPFEQTPHPNSSKATKHILFDSSATTIRGKATVTNDQIKSVNWTARPVNMVITVPRTIRAAPSSAEITLSVAQNGEPIATLESMAVEFAASGESYVAGIAFDQRIAGPLTETLRNHKKGPGVFQITAQIDYMVDLGEVGKVRILGPIGNGIEMTIGRDD